MASWAQLDFNESVTPTMQDFIFFHDHVMLVLVAIISFVGLALALVGISKTLDVFFLENQYLEVIWTLIPVFILLYIGAPSLYVLYSMDYDFLWGGKESSYFLKVNGHQWYWTYSSPSFLFGGEARDIMESYISPLSGSFDETGQEFSPLRLLDVDNRVVLPCEVLLKIYVSSMDVLHSWALPSAGIKLDACPGRLNQVTTYFNRPGVFYGQCSEICGANHSFMPIVVESRELMSHLNQLQVSSLK